jgi:hypothetical protein
MRNPFITFREKDDDGILQYYVLQRGWPHYLGLVTDNPHLASILKVPLAGYRFYVSYSGVLVGNYAPSSKEGESEMLLTLQQMANWFLKERILPYQRKYKNWKI